MVDLTDAEAKAIAAAAAASVGTQQSETNYSDKRGNANQASSNESDQDLGADEAVAAAIANDVLAYLANGKRSYDEYQHESLNDIRRGRQHANNVDNLAVQALQNAVETANMVSKQAVRHSDIAIDRQWNVDEVSTLTAKNGVEADAVMAVLINQIADKLNNE